MIGQRLLHYEVTEKLGEGGMGVVYKARDTHLDRFVAIKVLPPARVADPARKARFVQEAKAASALNHPNIVTIHDISADSGHDFIAMEYVAGKTIDQLIPRKGMRLNEALKIAVQIADALARAHAAGIIHRDLKPANVMVDEHGLVKVLDFGLAKLTEQVAQASACETATLAVKTDDGAIVGTASYMSPEQAEGRPVDARSDIFSFGAMLYEMFSGRRAFSGILRQEPQPVEDLSHDLQKLVTRCLRPDPARRFQTMADLTVTLRELKDESDSGVLTAPRVALAAPARRTFRLAILGGALLLVALAAAGWFWFGALATPEAALHAVPLTTYEGLETHASFSPDGNQLAFAWFPPDIKQQGVYVKMIGAEAAQRRTVPPAPYPDFPSWSPDGRWIAVLRVVFPRQVVLLIPSIGGPERRLAEVGIPNGVTTGIVGPWVAWSHDSNWLIVVDRPTGREAALFALSVSTSERRKLTSPPTGAHDSDPAVSPDGRTLVFTRTLSPLVSDLYVLPVSTPMTPAGEARRVTFDNQWTGGPAWSADGREIVYSAGSPAALWRVKASGAGKPRRLPLGSEEARGPSVSRQGRRLVYARSITDTDIYRVDLTGAGGPAGAAVKLVSSTQRDEQPQVSRDGARIAFISERSGSQELWVSASDGSNPAQLTSFGGAAVARPIWSPDGKLIAFDSSAGGKWSAYVVNTQVGVPRQLNTDPPGTPSSWSDDGKWIYLTSQAPANVWKASPGGGQTIQVTRNGGRNAVESPDAKFLYYVKGPGINGSLYRMPLAGGDEAKVLDGLRDDLAFAVAERGVYHLSIRGARLDGGNSALQFYDFATGTAKPVVGIEPMQSRFDIVPGGRSIFFAKTEKQNTDLMLVENFR